MQPTKQICLANDVENLQLDWNNIVIQPQFYLFKLIGIILVSPKITHTQQS